MQLSHTYWAPCIVSQQTYVLSTIPNPASNITGLAVSGIQYWHLAYPVVCCIHRTRPLCSLYPLVTWDTPHSCIHSLPHIGLNTSEFVMQCNLLKTVQIRDLSLFSSRYFDQGAIDIYNCPMVAISNSQFSHNRATTIVKPYRFQGQSAALSIGR